MRKKLKSAANYSDVVLIGAGVMSATLGVLLKELQPDLILSFGKSIISKNLKLFLRKSRKPIMKKLDWIL